MIESTSLGAPPTAEAPAPRVLAPLDAEALGAWQARIDRADSFRKKFEPQWERSLERYAKALYDKDRYDVNALLDFRHVENTKSSVFHRTPEILLNPADPEDQSIPYAALLPQRQKYLNFKLGRKGANAKRALHKTIVDALAASGWMACEVGYENRTLPVPGMVHPDGSPVEVPIWERMFISRISPKKLLIPDDFYDTDFDAAPWLGYKGTMPLSKARRQRGWKIPEGFMGSTKQDVARFTHGIEGDRGGDSLIEYHKLWYYAEQFDETVFHPELMRCLVFIDGIEGEVYHHDSPYQTLLPDGTLTDDSLRVNPIRIDTLRDLPDSAHVPCDLTVGEQLSREVNKFRTQLIRNRNKRSPITLVSDQLGQDKVKEIGENAGPIVVPQEFIVGSNDQRAVAVVNTGTEPRDNMIAQDRCETDWQQALGSSDNRSGQITKRKVTATEVRNVQGNTDARNETTKDRVREYFIGIVEAFDCIVQRTATEADVRKVLGAQGAALWSQWKVLPGKYAYNILPDSGTHVDATQYRAQKLDEYNLLRKDDRVSADELLKDLARALGHDPARFIVPPPDKTTEPPKASVSFGAVDLNDPVAGRVFLDLAANGGVKMSPDTIALMKAAHLLAGLAAAAQGGVIGANANSEHGGSADTTEPVNKHQSERTGGVQGVGVQ